VVRDFGAAVTLPSPWPGLIFELLHLNPPPAARKRGRNVDRERNHFIIVAIKLTVRRGFPATRNRAAKNSTSACSIVAKALSQLGVNLTERSVERIWERRKV
jgi:hypothetical protein